MKNIETSIRALTDEFVADVMALLLEQVRAEVLAALPEPGTRRARPAAAPVVASGARRLSERELEVLRGVASGLTSNAIAEKHGISARTVETYRTRIQKKIGHKLSVADMTRWAIEHGLV